MKTNILKKLKAAAGLLIAILIGLAAAWVFRQFVFFNAIVPSGSMEPGIAVGDQLIGSRLAYKQSDPERGDVILFEDPTGIDRVCLKRIIGLPGETLEIIEGLVYINGSPTPLDESYVNPADPPTGSFGPYIIPEGQYFVMGDNRNDSLDSRFWDNSFVSFDEIIAKVIFRYYPSFGKVK